MGDNPSKFKGENYPVECVNWYQAIEYCEKLSKLTGRKYRLPSESEWEYVGRAGTQTPFYCGEVLYEATDSVPENVKKNKNSQQVDDIFGCLGGSYLTVELLANFQFDRGFDPILIHKKSSLGQKTTPVGSFLPNDFGIYDMHGNVWEWCEDLWHNNYQAAPTDGSAWIIDEDNLIDRDFLSLFTNSDDNSCDQRVVRGGSWCSESKFCRVDYRNYFMSSEYNNALGFRICC